MRLHFHSAASIKLLLQPFFFTFDKVHKLLWSIFLKPCTGSAMRKIILEMDLCNEIASFIPFAMDALLKAKGILFFDFRLSMSVPCEFFPIEFSIHIGLF